MRLKRRQAEEGVPTLFDAIERLTEENRRARSAETEFELVKLRHDAFTELGDPPHAEPAAIVPEPSTGALPRVDPAGLDLQALRDGLASGGCLLVPGLIPAHPVAGVGGRLDRA